MLFVQIVVAMNLKSKFIGVRAVGKDAVANVLKRLSDVLIQIVERIILNKWVISNRLMR